jgi:uncharacterized protein YbjT (DUF2867 family)
MSSVTGHRILVTGATGFIGRALVPALCARGAAVVAASRQPAPARTDPCVEWRACDLLQPETLPQALAGVQVAYYLVHSMGSGDADFREHERRSAEAFVNAAAHAGVERIVYLGGPVPPGPASEHLRSRLAVGEILRSGSVLTVELRASMVIGNGSASWQIARDLAMRLPLMILPMWLRSRTRPVALDDVVIALIAAAELPLAPSVWFDVPGPEALSGREILERIAAVRGRRIHALEVPLLTPRLSALWLKLITSADFALARELVIGLAQDLLPEEDRFWRMIGHCALVPFDRAARRALDHEVGRSGAGARIARAEERLVGLTAARGRRA